ncbi:hypothetical protein BH23ACT9_BH23ACT9_34050 [soil metagenome]
MKKLLLIASIAALMLPALPGAALPLPTPTPSPSPTPTPTATATPDPAAETGPTLTYAGRGLTNALGLTFTDQGLQTGVTNTRVANAATDECAGIACALGAGAAPPFGDFAIAVSPGNPGPNSVQAFDLGEDASPEFEQLLTLTIGAATAQTTDQPFSTATANGLSLDLTITQTVLENLPEEVTGGLEDALGQIAEGLSPIAEGDPTGTIGGLTDLLEGLVGDLTSSPLVRIQAGQSTSSADFEDGTVSADAAAAGAVIVILPTPVSTPLLPEGLAIIEVGPSMAAATADGTNRATTAARASIARITLLPGILDGLPGLDPGDIGDLPLDAILDLLPEEITDLLPIGDLLDGLGGGDDAPGDEPGDGDAPDGDGPTGTPLDDILGGFMQADPNSGGFVIDLETGTEQTCILEDTPLESCITLGGTSETFTADGLGVGVLAAGVDLVLFRGLAEMAPGAGVGGGLIELNIGRSEAGVAAAFVQAPLVPTPTPTPTPIPPPPGLPQTGSANALVVPSLLLMMLSGVALVTLRRRREI